VHPVDEKDIRVRGPLVAVNEDEMSYTIAVRPFHDRIGDFGRFKVSVTDETEFEVDGEMWVGVEGLRALNAAGQGTPTVAKGTLTTSDRTFTADLVLARATQRLIAAYISTMTSSSKWVLTPRCSGMATGTQT